MRIKYHILAVLAGMLVVALPLQAQEKEYTYKVKNTAAAWGGTSTYDAGSTKCVEYYSTDHFYHGTFAQTITGLPVGVYEAEIYFNASCAAWNCAEICANGTTGRTHLYLNDAEVDVPIYNIKEITEPKLYTIKNIHVTDGTLYMGARNDREGANWHLIRLKSLKFIGTDARSLYDAQFPLIRKARLALAASTCPNNQEMLKQAISESMVASAYDSQERLQTLYDNISTAISESERFEAKKATTLKNLLTRLSTFQRVWNNGDKSLNTAQRNILMPAVAQVCIAKDSECDLEAMDIAREALNQAMTETTGIMAVVKNAATQTLPYTLDGRKATNLYKGLIIESGTKVLR